MLNLTIQKMLQWQEINLMVIINNLLCYYVYYVYYDCYVYYIKYIYLCVGEVIDGMKIVVEFAQSNNNRSFNK